MEEKNIKEPNKQLNRKTDPNTYQLKKNLKKELRTQKSIVNGLEKKVTTLERELEEMNEKLKEPDAYNKPENKVL